MSVDTSDSVFCAIDGIISHTRVYHRKRTLRSPNINRLHFFLIGEEEDYNKNRIFDILNAHIAEVKATNYCVQLATCLELPKSTR